MIILYKKITISNNNKHFTINYRLIHIVYFKKYIFKFYIAHTEGSVK